MTQAQIMAYALPPIAPDAVLFLWRVASMPQEPLDVARAWGFRPHSELVWQKLTAPARPVQPCQLCGHTAHKHHFGMGRIVRGSHETCLIAVRGKPRILTRSIRSTFAAPVGRHSAKPEAFYDIVEDLCTGPRVELFARRNRAGWVCIGDEVGALDALDASDASDTNPVAKVG
jgi:N6-adenosine-specific RNA methylase IME4